MSQVTQVTYESHVSHTKSPHLSHTYESHVTITNRELRVHVRSHVLGA
jgi:hypothetical protein